MKEATKQVLKLGWAVCKLALAIGFFPVIVFCGFCAAIMDACIKFRDFVK